MKNITPMPVVNNVCDLIYKSENNGKQESLTTVPILGQITHQDKCIFFKMQDCQAWYTSLYNLFFDGYGFWTYTPTTLTYKNTNKLQPDQQFHPRTLPYIIRFKNQPQRSIINQLKLFLIYFQQNTKLTNLNTLKHQSNSHSQKFDNQGKLIRNQFQDEVGQFKAYSNGLVIAKFIDRSLLTLNSKTMQAKIISSQTGQTSHIDLTNPDTLSYKQHKHYIIPTLTFQQQTFYPQQWLSKQHLSSQIQTAIQISNTFQKTNKTYLKL